jgi:hypothetical protein
MDDDFNVVNELFMFAFNIKKEMCGVLDSFLSFLQRYEERKTHNIFSLMLDTRFKSLHL